MLTLLVSSSNESLLSCCFQDPLFVFSFQQIMMCLVVNLWVYPTWNSLNFLYTLNKAFNWIWAIVSSYLFKYSFCSFHSLLCFWNFCYVHVSIPDSVLHVSEFLVISLYYFFLCFGLDNLSWPIFKFTDSFSSNSNHIRHYTFQLFNFRISIQFSLIPIHLQIFSIDTSFSYFL